MLSIVFNLVSLIVPHGTLFRKDVVCAIAKTGAIPIGKINEVSNAKMTLVGVGDYVLVLAGAGNVAAKICAVVFVKCALVQHLAKLLKANRACGFLFRIHVFTSLVCYLRRACDRSLAALPRVKPASLCDFKYMFGVFVKSLFGFDVVQNQTG